MNTHRHIAEIPAVAPVTHSAVTVRRIAWAKLMALMGCIALTGGCLDPAPPQPLPPLDEEMSYDGGLYQPPASQSTQGYGDGYGDGDEYGE